MYTFYVFLYKLKLNFTFPEVSKEDPEATLEDTNCSTIDASLDHNTLEVVIDQDRERESESMDSVFSPEHR